MTRFAACFLLVFGELAFGGMLALAVPPFFKVERGFYKSSAGVYLACALVTAVGLGLLAGRGGQTSGPGTAALWLSAGLWTLFSATLAFYLFTLWTDNGLVRSRAYVAGLGVGLIALITNMLSLMPTGFGVSGAAVYIVTAIASAVVLGLVSGGMMFGHWYLIDPNLPVDYLRSFVRLLRASLIGDLAALGIALAGLGAASGAGAGAVRNLLDFDPLLLSARILLGPVATMILAWMTWKTLEVPQTMAATGLLYIAVMAALVGEMLGRFILFRTAVPL
ncbi:MAG TPA: hypothetical protein VEJ86_09820 [Candidatus Binataceae bacterium]|nr:hypothetical protein [Candidatus Binataceae bacterium]